MARHALVDNGTIQCSYNSLFPVPYNDTYSRVANVGPRDSDSSEVIPPWLQKIHNLKLTVQSISFSN